MECATIIHRMQAYLCLNWFSDPGITALIMSAQNICMNGWMQAFPWPIMAPPSVCHLDITDQCKDQSICPQWSNALNQHIHILEETLGEDVTFHLLNILKNLCKMGGWNVRIIFTEVFLEKILKGDNSGQSFDGMLYESGIKYHLQF